VGIEASHLSQQLAVLRRAGLVTTRKEGSMVIYKIKSPLVKKLLATAKQLLVAQLSETRALLDGLRAEAPAG
jgi:ArsR family transcriptional regulator